MRTIVRALLVLIISSSARVAWAQNDGVITGTVKDAQAAVLPGVSVEAKNPLTNVAVRTVTTGEGVYQIINLGAGRYQVSFALSGFQTNTREIEVCTGERLQVDVTLAIGGLQQSVTVVDETPILTTTTASRANVIPSELIVNTPTFGRQVMSLVQQTAGVVHDINFRTNDGRPFNTAAMDSFVVNGGGGSGNNNAFLDGVPNVVADSTVGGARSGMTGFVPSPEAVQEIRVDTNNYDAQYGRTGGATVNITVKSGTNRYGGTGTYVMSTGGMTQNSYQNKLNGIPQANRYERNPGWTFGGPVKLPGYDGRNRTFFFYSGEYLDQRDSRDGARQRAITPLERQGDFSQSFTPAQIAAGGNRIIDPLTRQPFANNRIPAARSVPGCGLTVSCMDPISEAFLAFAPEPNAAVDPTNLTNFIAPDNGEGDHYHTHLFRGDHILPKSVRLSARWGYNWRAEDRVHQGRTVQAIPDVFNIRQNGTAGLDLTWTMGAATVSSVKVGYSQHLATLSMYPGDHWDKSDTPWDNARLGLSATHLSLIPRTDYFYPVRVTDFTGVNVGEGGGQVSDDYTWTTSYSLSSLVGRHTIKVGLQTGLNRYWVTAAGYTGTGSTNGWTFNRNFTSAAPATVGNLPVAAGGLGLASFMLGYPASETITLGAGQNDYAASYYGVYVQDDWRITSRLTLNLGLRYDYERPVTQQQGFAADGFVFDAANPLVCAACAAVAAGLDIAANRPDGGAGLRSLQGGLSFADGPIADGDRDNFGPRVGITYNLTPKTVVRAGYGLSFQNTIGNRGLLVGSTAANSYVPSLDGGQTPAANLSETLGRLYPNGLVGPSGRSRGLLTNIGLNVSPQSRRVRTPEFHQYSADLQRQLPWRSVITIAYVGSRTLQLPLNETFNDLTPAQIALGDTFLNQQVPNPFVGLLPGTTFNTATVQRRQLLRPYPAFGNITINGSLPDGRQWYNSGQLTWQKRLSHGVAANVAYTYARAWEEIDPLNAGEPRYKTYRGGAAGRRHALRINPTYATPKLDGRSRLLRWVLGGWQAGLSISWVSGIPINMPDNVDVIGEINLDNPTFGRWFNTCTIGVDGSRNACADPGVDDRPRDPGRAPLEPAFRVRPANSIDTTGPRVDTVLGHRVPYIDARWEKIFYHGTVQYSVSADMYNMFGLVQFGNPTTAITNFGTFGAVAESQNNDTRIVLLNFRIRY